jgi:DnaJ-class molecular chaperone
LLVFASIIIHSCFVTLPSASRCCAGTQHGDVLCIPGGGLSCRDASSSEGKGDHFVSISIVVPSALAPDEYKCSFDAASSRQSALHHEAVCWHARAWSALQRLRLLHSRGT